MSRPSVTDRRPRPPDPVAGQTDALWQYLRRIEHGLDQIDARIDRL